MKWGKCAEKSFFGNCLGKAGGAYSSRLLLFDASPFPDFRQSAVRPLTDRKEIVFYEI